MPESHEPVPDLEAHIAPENWDRPSIISHLDDEHNIGTPEGEYLDWDDLSLEELTEEHAAQHDPDYVAYVEGDDDEDPDDGDDTDA